MNVWLQNPRVEKAEVDAFEAERAERRGDPAAARSLYHDAAEAFASVALGALADYPNTRSDLAIAAVASFARAGDFGRSIEFGRRMLAEIDALTAHGRTELAHLVRRYVSLVAESIAPAVTLSESNRGSRLREQVRSRFKRAA